MKSPSVQVSATPSPGSIKIPNPKFPLPFLLLLSLLHLQPAWSASEATDATVLSIPATGVFLPVSPLDNQLYVAETTQAASALGLSFVNLILDWKDLEPANNQFQFADVAALISAIQSRGLQCVLRIYFNAASFGQPSPDWLFDLGAAHYTAGLYRQPLPWDTTYQAQVEELLANLSSYFTSSGIAPEALQISVGGDFGEQYLSAPYTDYGNFIDQLFAAEQWHVRTFHEYLGARMDLILMINALTDPSEASFDTVLQTAFELNYRWVQSNAGIWRLRNCQDFGPDTIEMVRRFTGPGEMRFLLEDEYSAGEINECGGNNTNQRSIAARTAMIATLQREEGIRVDGITLDEQDLLESQQAIDGLIEQITSDIFADGFEH